VTFNKVVFDIETTMTADKVWCIVCKHEDTFYQFKENNLHRFEEFIKQTEEVIGHNIIGFDIPVLNKFFGYDLFKNVKITDTLILSRLLNPMIDGGHSLRNWGTKLGQSKIEFEQFDFFSEEMLKYCRNDVDLTQRLYKFLITRIKDFGYSVELEHEVAKIIQKQHERGFKIDIVNAYATNIPEAKLINKFLMLQKRIAQVSSWVEAIKEDGRVHGKVITNGTITGRMSHQAPNMAQIPAVYSPYGKECRGLWIVDKGFKLVGVDASGLEIRMLAHYMNDKEYTNEVINGDIHTANKVAAGLETRDAAKTFIYAFIYGAGSKKIGSIIGGSERDGERVKEKFLRATPSLRNLREKVDAVAKSNRRWLKGLDGRKIIIRHPHAALNSLLQGAGAIVMKVALTLLEQYVINKRIKAYPVVNVHDEFQYEVEEGKAEEFGRLAVQSIIDAGKEYRIGNNWAETH
jgi:DNA polymerase I-like protein with 3'-5' exonuclease and polymerase domains